MTHRNANRPFHMSIQDAKDIKDGILNVIKDRDADRFEYLASNDAEIYFERLHGFLYKFEAIDVTRTYGVEFTFDELDDITVEEEFLAGYYTWVLNIDATERGYRRNVRMMLVSQDRRGRVIK